MSNNKGKEKVRKNSQVKSLFAYLMSTPSLIILIMLSLFPLFFTLKNSFTDYYLLSKEPANLVYFENYKTILSDPYFHQAVMNTVKFTLISVFFETLIGLGLAIYVNSFEKGKKILRTIVLLPMLIPPVTVALIWQTLMSNNEGVLNKIIAIFGVEPINWLMDIKYAFASIVIIDIWQYTPLAFLLIYAALQTVPQDQYKAAAIDGANAWVRFTSITLPNISNGIVIVILLRTIDTFRLFDKVNILTKGGPANSTATITQYIYQYGTKSFKIGYAAAASVIMTILVLILSGVYLKKTFKSNLH